MIARRSSAVDRRIGEDVPLISLINDIHHKAIALSSGYNWVQLGTAGHIKA